MSADPSTPVIVFDGVCVLCNGWVRFLLRRDGRGVFRFAAMQTPTGRALLQANALDPDDPRSFLLIDEAGTWTDTVAIARVLCRLGGPWTALGVVMQCVPQRLRDATYRCVARNRYRWFGRHARCVVPSPETRGRFIE